MGECWGEGGVHRYSVIEHSMWVNVGGGRSTQVQCY